MSELQKGCPFDEPNTFNPDMKQYHDRAELSQSKLTIVKCLRDGLPSFKAKKETLDFGSQLHEAVFESEKYKKNLLIDPSYKVNKFKIQTMADSARKNILLKFILDSKIAKFEHEHFFEEAKYGIKCKAKFDIVAGKTIGDLKTTDSQTSEEFIGRIFEYGYHRQAAFYLDSADCDKFIIFGIAKKYPHPTFTFTLDRYSEAVEAGRKEYEELIDCYLEMKKAGKINF